jgi:RES domain-containing protein
VTISVWRISNHADLSGEGGRRAAGRWNQKGTPIVYCSDHPANAMLEILVNVDREDLPSKFKLLEIELRDDMIENVDQLPENWQNDKSTTREIYQRFIQSAGCPVLKVPSVVTPKSWNFLINPNHPNAIGIRIVGVTEHIFDPRFWG